MEALTPVSASNSGKRKFGEARDVRLSGAMACVR